MTARRERVLFVTGKLAEPGLRRVLAELQPAVTFDAEVAVLPITVAALLTTKWVASHLTPPDGVDRIVLPGLCRGDPALVETATHRPTALGPKDLRDLPAYFGHRTGPPAGYGKHDIEILAELNHAPQVPLDRILALAREWCGRGADIIDLGCDPGGTWDGIGPATAALRAEGIRVSVDSFNPVEVETALAAGAELVLSVNSTNASDAVRWQTRFPDATFVVIPDTPSDLDSMHRTVDVLHTAGVRYRLDPILEPIGFGFAASLGRYIETRQKYPDAEIMMGIGNLTELTDVDSAGVNVVLAGFCQELGIRSVLTTEVINWCRSSVTEFAMARRLVFHAIQKKVLPKRLEPGLVMLRDPRLHVHGEQTLRELADRITDRNYRIFAERGELHVMNGTTYLRGTDPFQLFAEMLKHDARLDASHAFYLGYEMAKAVTALTLGKNYEQDRALRWGFLTVPEISHRNAGL